MEYRSNLDERECYKKTIIHSRLPIHIYHNFKINTLRNDDGSINTTRYSRVMEQYSKSKSRLLNKADWGSILGAQKLAAQSDHFNDESRNNNNISIDKDGDTLMANDREIQDDVFEPFLDQEFTYVTIMIYYNSFSINNGPCIPFPGPVISAAILKSMDVSQEDTLAVHLQGGVIFLRLVQESDTEFLSFIVDSVHVGRYSLHGSNMFFNSTKDNMLLYITNGTCMHFGITYNDDGIPITKHTHNSQNDFQYLDSCMVSVGNSDDALITMTLGEGILRFHCMTNFKEPKINTVIMRNSFAIPVGIVGLAETSAVLILQERGFSIKSLGFFMNGEEKTPFNFEYPAISGGFKVNGIYTPGKKIKTLTSFNEFSDDLYKHDQVLISTSNNNSVYSFDIYYDKKRHVYSCHVDRLFKYKQVVSNFIFEPISNSNFQFIFANETGKTESKIVSIITKDDRPILKTVQEIWSEINSYPIFDFELIESPNAKKSIEYPTQELWMLAGAETNHSLMNFKVGLIADKPIDFQRFTSIDELHYFKSPVNSTKYLWVSNVHNTQLFKIGDDDCLQSLYKSFVQENILSLEYLDPTTQLIITPNHLFVFDIDRLTTLFHVEFPYSCIYATSLENTIAVLYIDNETQLAMFNISIAGGKIQLVHIEIDTPPNHNRKISMLKLIKLDNALWLLIGDFDGHLIFYKSNLGHTMQFVSKQVLRVKPSHILSEPVSLEYKIIPYKILQLDDSMHFIITSRTGDYIIFELYLDNLDNTCAIYVLQHVKLSDTGGIDIISTDKLGAVYLLGKTLWKLNIKQSLYPDRVLFNDGLDLCTVSSCAAVTKQPNISDDLLFVIRNSELKMWTISKSVSAHSKRHKLEVPCMKMKYYSLYDMFVLIPFPDSEISNKQKLIVVDAKYGKILKLNSDLTNIFTKSEIPVCLYVWKVRENGGVYTNLIVGCKFEGVKGSMKVLRIERESNGSINIKTELTFLEDLPVTSITSSKIHNMLLYSTGNEIYSIKKYNNTEGTSVRKLFTTINFPIKKLDVTKVTGTNLESVLVITQNNMSFNFTLESRAGDVHLSEVASNDRFFSDGLINGKQFIVASDFKKQTLSVTDERSFVERVSTKLDTLGYIPRLSPIESFPPWLYVDEREPHSNGLHFITVGLNGQIDLYSFSMGLNYIYQTILLKRNYGRSVGYLSEYPGMYRPSLGDSVDMDLYRNPEITSDQAILDSDRFTKSILL